MCRFVFESYKLIRFYTLIFINMDDHSFKSLIESYRKHQIFMNENVKYLILQLPRSIPVTSPFPNIVGCLNKNSSGCCQKTHSLARYPVVCGPMKWSLFYIHDHALHKVDQFRIVLAPPKTLIIRKIKQGFIAIYHSHKLHHLCRAVPVHQMWWKGPPQPWTMYQYIMDSWDWFCRIRNCLMHSLSDCLPLKLKENLPKEKLRKQHQAKKPWLLSAPREFYSVLVCFAVSVRPLFGLPSV